MSFQENSEIQYETYKPGEVIFFEGDIDFHFYFLEQGEVQIFTKSPTGNRINITTIKAGESFGEFALLSKDARSASAQALTEVNLVKISQAGYEQLLNDLPIWAASMMRNFAIRLISMNKKLKDLPQFVGKK